MNGGEKFREDTTTTKQFLELVQYNMRYKKRYKINTQ